jgi:hypothetical protein
MQTASQPVQHGRKSFAPIVCSYHIEPNDDIKKQEK